MGLGNKISFEEFADQWVMDRSGKMMKKSVGKVLSDNASQFATLAGEYAKECFVKSFDNKRFYGGQQWPERKSQWGLRKQHELMIETGKLRDGIKGEFSKYEYGKINERVSRDLRRRYHYDIYTTETCVPSKGNHGKIMDPKRKGYSYAAVHNDDGYMKNGHSNEPAERRQFIGHSDQLYQEIAQKFIPELFKGFPK